jgi:hypothetical protein
MPSIRSMIAPGRRLLARHLTRLGETLETFGQRLREAVSSAVGETVAAIVRETVRAVLAEQPTLPPASERFVQRPRPPRPLWERPDDLQDEPWFDNPDNDPPEEEDVPPSNRTEDTGDPSRLPRALAVGFHTTLCCLRRRVSRYPVLTAVAVGLLTALATYAGGPLAAAAVALAGSAFNLLSLAEAVDTGADALAAFGCP